MTVYASRPLQGMRIVITRPRGKSAEFPKAIEMLGGTTIEAPAINIHSLSDYQKMDEALSSLRKYSWLVFTSSNGVTAFFRRAAEMHVDVKSGRCRFAAIGSATASELERQGVKASFLPSAYLTENLALELPGVSGKRVLLVRAEGVDDRMCKILKRRGAEVDQVYAYRVEANRQRTTLGDFDAVVFSSPSTVRGFLNMVDRTPREINCTAMICCIGPATASAARKVGFRVDVVAREHTAKGLIQEIVRKVITG